MGRWSRDEAGWGGRRGGEVRRRGGGKEEGGVRDGGREGRGEG